MQSRGININTIINAIIIVVVIIIPATHGGGLSI
jgi:hypothetical protein